MNKTEKYQLNQWELTDRIQMEDFNSDNAKIDAALAEQAAELDTKASHTELAAAIPWVKIGEATLTAAAQTVSVSIPNAEQYACFFLLFDVSGTTLTGILWTGMSSDTTITNQGRNVMDRCCGSCLAAPLPNGGLLLRRSYCAVTGSTANGGSAVSAVSAAICSGNVTVSITGRNDISVEPLAAGGSLVVYGLKK